MLASIVFIGFGISDTYAQRATKSEYKQFNKEDRFLNKKIKSNAVKDARKEAKHLTKQGYVVPIGKLPLAKQLEDSWQAQYEKDKNGYPYYFIATSSAIAGNQSAGFMQATNLAKLNIAGQIQTRVSQIIESKIANNSMEGNNAASINSFVSASKNIISNTLGRVITFVETYRILENKNVEVMVTLGYNSDLALQETIKALQKEMTGDAAKLLKDLDKLLAE